MTPMEKKIAGTCYRLPRKESLPELFENSERALLIKRVEAARHVLLTERGKAVEAREARLAARLELARIYAEADNDGIYLGQEAPSYSAWRDYEAIRMAEASAWVRPLVASRQRAASGV